MKKNYSLISVLAVFLVVSFIFNSSNWKEIFLGKNTAEVSLGDAAMAEFIFENNYQHVIQGKNPFILEKQLFHPFKSINVSLNDPSFSNVLFSLILRPFLDSHKTATMILLVNIFLNNLFMFLLLKKLKINSLIGVLISLVYGYLPVVVFRVFGHYTYASVYVFPMFYLLYLHLTKEKLAQRKLLISVLIGFLLTFLILLSFYYFIGLWLTIFFYSFYFIIRKRSNSISFFKNYSKYLIAALITFIVTALPWLGSVYKLVRSGMSQASTPSGVLELSGDLMGFFTPSEYNPVFKFLVDNFARFHLFFQKYSKFYYNNTFKFNYVGLMIILTFGFLIVFFKKIPKEIWKKIQPHLFSSLAFSLLTLGPFLKVFNRLFINLDGVAVVLPLPFFILKRFPGFSSVRAPTRFTPILIFVSLLVCAYLLDYTYKKSKGLRRIFLIIFLCAVFVADQYAVFPKQVKTPLPLKIYNEIKKSPSQGAVFEIPFTVRDGFQYIGYVHAIQPMTGQLIHGRPIIGGYIARVPPEIFEYYRDLPFVGYVSKIIDKGNYDPLKEKPKEPDIYPFPYEFQVAGRELDNLNIKYIILKENEKYTIPLGKIFDELDFDMTLKDKGFILLERI